MILVAISAATIAFTQWCFLSPAPRYRYVSVFRRKPDGSIRSVTRLTFDLEAPPDQWHGAPDGETRYREAIARLKAVKAEYEVTKPKGFKFNGEPIY